MEIPTMAEALMMARKKTTRPRKAPIPTTAKSLAFRVTADYGDWVEAFASFNRSTVSGLFDQALAEYAKLRGFKSPPERT
jgi:hypothetical protein